MQVVRTTKRERLWKRVAIVFMAFTLILSVNSISLVRGAFGGSDPLQTYHKVEYQVHNYRDGETYTLSYSVRSDVYERHRNDVLPKMQIAAGNDQAYARLVQPDHPLIQKMARDLQEVCGADEELYVNCALQVAHQMYYSLTPQAKTAVETLVEGSGDCDPQAVVVASLTEAVGIDTVLFLYWPHTGSDNAEVQWGHMQVGVEIDGKLHDARARHMDRPSAYEYEGTTYHVGEPTYERGFNPNWRDGWRLGENWYPREPDVVIEI